MSNLPHIRIVRSDRRTISIQIDRDGELLVRAPRRMSEGHINSFIIEHKEWIDKHLGKVKQKINEVRSDEDDYLFLGKKLKLFPGNYAEISVHEDKLLFPKVLMFRKEKEIYLWYTKQAKSIITMQVGHYAKQMNAEVRQLTFSDTKAQWGRCTRDNRLQFSWRLIMAPILVVNYVIVHELVHTFVKNHSRTFWEHVNKHYPSYKRQIKWLKDYGPALHAVN